MHPLEIFTVVSGSFSILATFPLIYLAFRSLRDARELRRVQSEVAELIVEVREIQSEIHHEQREAASELLTTREVVERVERATQPRRRLPRIRVELSRG